MPDDPTIPGTLTRGKLIALIAVAGLLMPVLVFGVSRSVAALGILVVLEGIAVAALFVAAGGYGWLVIRKIVPDRTGGALAVLTASAVGLWLLAVGMLLVGTCIPGAMKLWVWWPVVAVGVLLAAWQGRRKLEGWRVPESFDGRVVTWAALALAAGLWLVGASQPPGFWRQLPQAYEVVERYLQIPREFFDAQRITALDHHCRSYEPLGGEMLFLLGMSLRGGAHEGMYLAKVLHGAFAVLAVAGVFAAFKDEDHLRGRIAAVLLATTPLVLLLSWLGRVDLMRLCYLTFALLWLRQWMRGGSGRSALLAGGMLGAACMTGWDAAVLVAAPVLLVMLIAGAIKGGRVRHVGPALVAVGVMLLPWLVRTAAYTHNPVFPRGTALFGRAHWDAESQQRWLSAHSVPPGGPVPPPPGWGPPESPSRLELLYHRVVSFRATEFFGPPVLVIALIAACAVLATSKADPWDRLLIAVVAVQLAALAAFTPSMPPEQMVLIMVPVCLLAAGGLSRLARIEKNPFRKKAAPPPMTTWGLAPAVAITAAAMLVNLVIGYRAFQFVRGFVPSENDLGKAIPAPPGAYRGLPLNEKENPLLVGSSHNPFHTPFYGPPKSIYASRFDMQWLASVIGSGSATEVMERLRERHITHVVVDWLGLWGLAHSTGCPAILSEGLYERATSDRPPALGVLERLKPLGLRVEQEIIPGQPQTRPATKPAASSPAGKQTQTMPASASVPRPKGGFPRDWPLATIYVLPWAPTTQPATHPVSGPAAR